MAERPFRRVVLVCDAACDIRIAVADATILARRWGAALHGVFFDDENLHRFAALPFGRPVSLSSTANPEGLTAGHMARLASALGSAMRRELSQAASEHGLDWSFGTIRDLPSAARFPSEEGDILVIEAAARAFSGAWRPHSAWDKSPFAFPGTVLLKGRRHGGRGILVALPADKAARDRVLAAGAAITDGEDDIALAGTNAALRELDEAIAGHFSAGQRARIKRVVLDEAPSALAQTIAQRKPGIVVLHAASAGAKLDDVHADTLLVK
ncbi:MAG TPA: hypothetical protein VLV50_00295 [Stellaceae bacterium]|nr:hypothetical protein [Stellaceae bacterium]